MLYCPVRLSNNRADSVGPISASAAGAFLGQATRRRRRQTFARQLGPLHLEKDAQSPVDGGTVGKGIGNVWLEQHQCGTGRGLSVILPRSSPPQCAEAALGSNSSAAGLTRFLVVMGFSLGRLARADDPIRSSAPSA